MSKVIDKLLGREDSESGTSEVPASSGSADHGTPGPSRLAALKAVARKSGISRAQVAAQEAAEAADLEMLYSQENWEVLSSLYFDARYAMTGFEPFKLNEKQAKVLSVMTAASLKTLRLKPEWVALAGLLTNFSALIIQKESLWSQEIKRRKMIKDMRDANGRQGV